MEHTEREVGCVRPNKHLDIRARFEERGVQLLPGIPNHVTVDHITTKLHWQTILVLSQISRGWQEAVRSRKVYDARVCSKSTAAFVVINPMCMKPEHKANLPLRSIGLYSPADRSFHLLPPIPCLKEGIPRKCQCLFYDGKIYVLGGENEWVPSGTMYVMDLAGQGRWERCANMRIEKRSGLGCGVLDGKIYVCGGSSYGVDHIRQAEVYDPALDTWSKLNFMEISQVDHQLIPMGDDLVMHGGLFFDHSQNSGWHINSYLMVYNPITDVLRTIDLGKAFCGNLYDKAMFVAEGKFHLLNKHGIYVFDMEKKTWTQRHEFSWEAMRREIGMVHPLKWTTLAVDNELVMIVEYFDIRRMSPLPSCVRRHLLSSIGFGGKTKTIAWKKVDCPESHPFQMFDSNGAYLESGFAWMSTVKL